MRTSAYQMKARSNLSKYKQTIPQKQFEQLRDIQDKAAALKAKLATTKNKTEVIRKTPPKVS